MLKNIRLIKWEFGTENKMLSTEICGKKWCISRGQWNGLMCSISGLGLSKFEREIFNSKFLQYDGHVNIYFLKWVWSWHSAGIYDNFRSVKITYDRSLYYIIKDKMDNIKKQINYKKECIIRKIKFQKQYNFTMLRSFEGEYSFTSDMLSAFQLATNYEACLYLNNRIIFSPLGFEWEENNKQVKKYTGFKWSKLGYKDPYSKEIKNYKRIPYQPLEIY